MAAPAPGVRVGSYRLVRLLGEGGMGMVFEAVHEGVGGRAAIKVLRPEAAARHDIAARFFNEARAANAVEHPSIIRIFDSGFTRDGVAYLAMEFLRGETLTRRMERVGRLPVAQSVLIARQVASALGAVHEREVVHRDLKPDNLMLVSDPEAPNGERIKLLDFGIARLTEELRKTGIQTLSGMLMGTPAYMSPEQCRGAKSVTTRSDVYSLGVMLYQMLAGRPPFVSEGVGDLLAMHIKDPPPPLRQIVDVPPELAHLVHSMLAKAPDDRPTMDAVAKALRGMSRSLTPAAPARAEGAPAAESPSQTVEPPAERGEPAATAPASAAPAPSVLELVPAELEEVGAEDAPGPGNPPPGSAQAPTSKAPRVDLSQLPTLHPGVRAPGSSQPPSERPPQSAPHVPTLRSFAGETFGAARTVRRVGVSLGLFLLVSGAGALSYSLLRARPPARPVAASSAPLPPGPPPESLAEAPRPEVPPSRPAPPVQEPEAAAAPAPARPAEPSAVVPPPAKPAPPAAPVRPVDPHLAAARQHLSARRYEEAFAESGRCAADPQLACAALQARAACRTNRRVVVQELQGRIAAAKLPARDRDRILQEITAECEADSLDHAEKFLAAKNFQSAQILARSLGKVYPVRASEIAGRAACALRDRPGALDAMNKLRTAKPQYESLSTYCKSQGMTLP